MKNDKTNGKEKTQEKNPEGAITATRVDDPKPAKPMTKAQAQKAAAEEMKAKAKQMKEEAKKMAEEEKAKKKADKEALDKAREEAKATKAKELEIQRQAEILPPLLKLNEEQLVARAEKNDKRARALDSQMRKSFFEFGMICLEMDQGKLWQKVRDPETGQYFTGFDDWLTKATPSSRALGYGAKKVAKRLLPFVPVAELEKIPAFALKVMAELPADIRGDKEILAAAQNIGENRGTGSKESSEKFIETVQAKAPEQHIEKKKPIVIAQSARDVLEKAIKVMTWVNFPSGEVPEDWDDADAIECMAAACLTSPAEVEGYFGKTNEQAFDEWQKSNPHEVIQEPEGEVLPPESITPVPEYSQSQVDVDIPF